MSFFCVQVPRCFSNTSVSSAATQTEQAPLPCVVDKQEAMHRVRRLESRLWTSQKVIQNLKKFSHLCPLVILKTLQML